MNKDKKVTINPLPSMSYPSYDERETAKREFYSEYPTLDDPWLRAMLILHKMCWAHYWRTMEAMRDLGAGKKRAEMKQIFGKDYKEGKEVSLYEYASHWLYNEQFRDDMFSADSEVLKVLKDLWGIVPKKHPMLAIGDTYYRNPSERCR